MQPSWLHAPPPPPAPAIGSWAACGWIAVGGGAFRMLAGLGGPWVFADQVSVGQAGAILFILFLGIGIAAAVLGLVEVVLGIITLAKPAHGAGTRATCIVTALLGLVLHAGVALLGLMLASDVPAVAYALMGMAFVGALGSVALMFLLPKTTR